MRVVFLDRDGVINKNAKDFYVLEWKDFEFMPGIIEAIKLLNERKIPVYIVSNQSAVGRGLMTMDELKHINDQMLKEITKKGAHIDDIFICPHSPEDNCDCRKPKTGLFKQAEDKYDIDFKDSWFIGDSETDIEAGKKMGCRTHLLKKGEDIIKVIRKII